MDSVRNKTCETKAEIAFPGKSIDKACAVPDVKDPAVDISAENSENHKLPFLFKKAAF